MPRRLACALLVLWSASALAQEAPRPDFSGNWLLDKEKSRLSAPAPDHAVFYVDHSYHRLWITRAHVTDGEADMLVVRVATDGDETVERWKDGKVFHRCRWEGDGLVLESRNRRRGKRSLAVAKLSLSPDGNTLTVEESLAGSGRTRESTWVLNREAPPSLADVTEDDLRQIKAAGLWYYVTKQPHAWQPFTVELGRGAYFPADEGRGPRIGSFEVTLEGNRLALVRQPPLGSVMVYFGFYLAKVGGEWVVLDEYFMEEWTDYEEGSGDAAPEARNRGHSGLPSSSGGSAVQGPLRAYPAAARSRRSSSWSLYWRR